MRLLLTLPLLFGTLLLKAQDPCDVSLTGTPLHCPGDDNATLTVIPGTPGQYTYVWDHDGSINGPTATGLGIGPYTVTVFDTSGCVSVLDTVITDPTIPPLGTLSYTDQSCAGANDATLTLTLEGPYTYFWIEPAGATGLTLTGLGPGTYVVGINPPPGGCPWYPNQEIGDPDINIVGITEYCPSDAPLLTAEPVWGFQPDVWLWSTNETTPSIQIVPGTSGEITVTAIDTSINCIVDATVTLTELPSPVVAWAIPDTTCVNVPTLVETIASTADSLVWHWQPNGFSNENDPLIALTQFGWQTISLQGFDSLGCGNVPLQDTIYAEFQTPAVLTVEQVPCTPFVDIVAGSHTDSCAFFIGDSLVWHDCSGYWRYDMRRYAEYTFTLYATQPNGCNDTTEIVVDVRTEPTLFLANSFTPNGDGINDLWPMRVDIPDDSYELMVFDRWGTLQWSSTDPTEQWDGTGNGGTLPLGVYPYTMRMRDPCQPTNEVSSKGHVTLFR